MRYLDLGEIFTEEQILCASACRTVQEIREVVVEPHMSEINAKLGQENDAGYLAYALAAALSSTTGWPAERGQA